MAKGQKEIGKGWISWATGGYVSAGKILGKHDGVTRFGQTTEKSNSIEKLEQQNLGRSESNYDDLGAEINGLDGDIVPDFEEESFSIEDGELVLPGESLLGAEVNDTNSDPDTKINDKSVEFEIIQIKAEDKGKEKVDPEKEQIFLPEIQKDTNKEDTIDDITFTVTKYTTPEAPELTLSNNASNLISDLTNGHTQHYSSSALANINTGLGNCADVGTNAIVLGMGLYNIKNDLALVSTITGAAELAVNLGAPTVSYLLGNGIVGTTATYFTHGAVVLAAAHPLAIPLVAAALVAAYDYQTLFNTAKSGMNIGVNLVKGTAFFALAGVDTVVIPAAMILDLYNIGKNGIKSPHIPVKHDGETITLALTDKDEATTIGKDWSILKLKDNLKGDNIDFHKMKVDSKGEVNNIGQLIEFSEDGSVIVKKEEVESASDFNTPIFQDDFGNSSTTQELTIIGDTSSN